MEINIYRQNGYNDREDYFGDLSRSYGVPLFVVYSVAEILGPDEDFDALPITLDDYGDMYRSAFN